MRISSDRDGWPVVLTADRTLMADYPTLFDGIMGTVQTRVVPEFIMRRFICPPAPRDGLRVRKAPLGLRRVEAALRRDGFSEADLIIVAPEDLPQAVGRRTRIIAVASGDPFGLGMSNTTMADMAGGQLYTARWYDALLRQIRQLKDRLGFRIVAGGAGAWQFAFRPEQRDALGVDTVVSGYAEGIVGNLFRRILAGESAPPLVNAGSLAAQDIPATAGATSMGVVEISRGCGKGCDFCTVAREPMTHLPEATILADAQTNLARGVDSLALVSEDVFRYGAASHAGDVNPAALKSLARKVRALRGLRIIQLDHANIISAARFSDDDLREVAATLTEGQRHRFLWINLGVETASGDLLDRNARGGKIRPWKPDAWAALCEETCRRMTRAGFFPFVSLILGLPGETPDDVRQTVRLVERLYRERLCIFPIFHAPVQPDSGKPFAIADMTADHWRLFRLSYDLNFRWIPSLFWDNQAAAGVGAAKRLFIQVTGRLQRLQWKTRFAWMAKKLREPGPPEIPDAPHDDIADKSGALRSPNAILPPCGDQPVRATRSTPARGSSSAIPKRSLQA
ncbi:MAG: B12-binding domain-containing radical SAM protein [Verrucomicrobiae bacterium]|nr:B12-binding domain-containing radical SAM protein [Verrucomicrobiae bacterium]